MDLFAVIWVEVKAETKNCVEIAALFVELFILEKFVGEAAPLLHFFLTVFNFYIWNACSFTRVKKCNFLNLEKTYFSKNE